MDSTYRPTLPPRSGYVERDGQYIPVEDTEQIDKLALVSSIVFVHLAQTEALDDMTVTEHSDLFPAWDENWTGAKGSIVRDGNELYRSIQDVGAGQNTKDALAPAPEVWYRVQIGAFRDKGNAERYLAKAKAAGFADAFIWVG